MIDARPELALNHRRLAGELRGATSAEEMLERLIGLLGREEARPDDLTVLVAHCTG